MDAAIQWKGVSFHALQHSFAAHVPGKGTDIRFIKEILAPFNTKTRERYLHVKRERSINTRIALDGIWMKGSSGW